MAIFKFTKAILNGDPIDVFNHGNMSRDFTYIDDLINSMRWLIDVIPKPGELSEGELSKQDSKSPVAPFRVVNIGHSKPTKLMDFIAAIEEAIGIKAVKNLMPMQAGDVPATWADTDLLKRLTGYTARTDTKTGIRCFVEWYRKYYAC